MTAAPIAGVDRPAPHRRKWVEWILFFLSVPIALVVGAAWFGADFLWVMFGPAVIFAAWGACAAVILWRRRSRLSFAVGALAAGILTAPFVAPLSMFPTLLYPSRALAAAADPLGSYLHFALHRSSYERQIGAMSGSPKLALFSRGG